MWINYLKIAWRNLLKYKTLSILNIGGLSISMAVAVLIGAYIFQEINVNKWMQEGDRIYRVYRTFQRDQPGGQANTPANLSIELTQKFPAIEQSTSLNIGYDLLFQHEDQALYQDEVAYVDSNFLSVFHLPLLSGNPEEALALPHTAIISESMARRFFNRTDVVGQTLRFDDAFDLTITGIYPDLTGRTHLDFDVFMRNAPTNNSWLSYRFETYVLTVPEVSIPELEDQITDYLDPILLHEFTQANFEITENDLPDWGLQPLKDIHLYSQNFGAIRSATGNARYLFMFGLIGILLLVIAAINYINLSTAKAGSRAREIGVRKVSGAVRLQLMGQFLVESVLQSTIGILLAFPLAKLILPIFNEISGRQLDLSGPELPILLGGLLILSLLVGILAGFYPAILLSAFKPVEVLKGEQKHNSGRDTLRKVLVVTQFTGVVVLVILTTVMFRQVRFMLQEDLGFASDQVIVLPLNTDNSWRRIEGRQENWERQPGITAVSTASVFPGEYPVDYTIEIEGYADKYAPPQMIFADASYARILDLKVLEGRFFSASVASDTLHAFVVNRQFVEEYDLKHPIGTRVRFPWREEWGEIIGVVEDYHYEGLDTKIEPLA
ncbi:MAG: ABC transporter permease, partial [Lewinella sp.]|nr:ABC transporter permease [Lewinella sp.]